MNISTKNNGYLLVCMIVQLVVVIMLKKIMKKIGIGRFFMTPILCKMLQLLDFKRNGVEINTALKNNSKKSKSVNFL